MRFWHRPKWIRVILLLPFITSYFPTCLVGLQYVHLSILKTLWGMLFNKRHILGHIGFHSLIGAKEWTLYLLFIFFYPFQYFLWVRDVPFPFSLVFHGELILYCPVILPFLILVLDIRSFERVSIWHWWLEESIEVIIEQRHALFVSQFIYVLRKFCEMLENSFVFWDFNADAFRRISISHLGQIYGKGEWRWWFPYLRKLILPLNRPI